MRGLDWLLVVAALVAVGAGLVFNGPVCHFNGGNVEFPGPYPCVPIFPGPALAGFGVAGLAVVILVIRVVRRARTNVT